MLCVSFEFHLTLNFRFYIILYTHTHCVSYSVNTWSTIVYENDPLLIH